MATKIENDYKSFRESARQFVDDIIASGMSYRDLAGKLTQPISDSNTTKRISITHTKLWGFHRNNAKIGFLEMKEIADRSKYSYCFTNITERGQKPVEHIDHLEEQCRTSITTALSHGFSYRTLAKKIPFSNETIRSFHLGNNMDAEKLFLLADYLGVRFRILPRKIKKSDLLTANR